jgi:succinate dehydrogenase hydrophobic anchor subunit
MTALGSTVSSFMEGLFYRGREGHLSFIGHRLAGLGTLLFLAIHIVDTSTVYFGKALGQPGLYSHAVDIYRSTPFMLGEILLVAAVFYHGVNGLKIILYDTFPNLWQIDHERQTFWRVAVITFLLWAPAAAMMGFSLYQNNIAGAVTPLVSGDTARMAYDTNVSLAVVPIVFFLILGVLAVGAKVQAHATPSGRRVAVPPKTIDTYVWQFMRWSGVLLIPLAWMHVVLQDVIVGVHSIDINFVALRWATTGWRLYDIALLGFAFGHGMFGLRTVVSDYVHSARWNRTLKWLMLVGWLVITAIGAVAIVGGVAQ